LFQKNPASRCSGVLRTYIVGGLVGAVQVGGGRGSEPATNGIMSRGSNQLKLNRPMLRSFSRATMVFAYPPKTLRAAKNGRSTCTDLARPSNDRLVRPAAMFLPDKPVPRELVDSGPRTGVIRARRVGKLQRPNPWHLRLHVIRVPAQVGKRLVRPGTLAEATSKGAPLVHELARAVRPHLRRGTLGQDGLWSMGISRG